MKPEDKVPDILTMKETCEILKVHSNTLRQWDKKGILKAVRYGERKDRRYKRDEVLKLLNN